MSGENGEVRKLREEVSVLREQLAAIAERLGETAVVSEDTGGERREEAQGGNFGGFETESFGDGEEDWGARRGRRSVNHHGASRGLSSEWGDRFGDYISDMVDSVMENVTSELERSLFTESRGKRSRPTVMTDMEVRRTASVMSALGNEHRVRILEELSWGGAYAGDLQEALEAISPSTLSSHLDVLQEAGLVTQEKRRGRYLITMAGRIAIQMAAQLARRASVS